MARKTYTTALRVVQQSNGSRDWNVHILQRMADIDLQRLNWKQALRVFEQIRTLRPDDDGVRKQLVELNLRMGQPEQAMSELENYLAYLDGTGMANNGVAFLEDLIKDHADQPLLKRALAQQLHRTGRTTEAVTQLDALGDELMEEASRRKLNAIFACSITGVATTCNDPTNTAALSAGDELGIKIAFPAGGTAAKVSWGLEITFP